MGIANASTCHEYQDLGESHKGLATIQESAIIGDKASCGVDSREDDVVVFEHAIGSWIDDHTTAGA